jgi:hypothetical protein
MVLMGLGARGNSGLYAGRGGAAGTSFLMLRWGLWVPVGKFCTFRKILDIYRYSQYFP